MRRKDGHIHFLNVFVFIIICLKERMVKHMNDFLLFCQENLVPMLFAWNVLLFLLMIIAIHKMNQTKKTLDHITGAVEGYLSAILSDEERTTEPVSEDLRRTESESGACHSKEEEQNRLISAVLQEIFP